MTRCFEALEAIDRRRDDLVKFRNQWVDGREALFNHGVIERQDVDQRRTGVSHYSEAFINTITEIMDQIRGAESPELRNPIYERLQGIVGFQPHTYEERVYLLLHLVVHYIGRLRNTVYGKPKEAHEFPRSEAHQIETCLRSIGMDDGFDQPAAKSLLFCWRQVVQQK